jgi:hypothetical protein
VYLKHVLLSFSSIFYPRWTIFVASLLFLKWKLLLSVDVHFFLTGTAITDRFTRLPATISLQQTSNRHHNSSYYDRSFTTRQHSRNPLVIKFLRQSTFSLLSGYNIDMLLMFLITTGEEKNTLWCNTSNVVSTANYRITLIMSGTKETLFLIVKIWWICMKLVVALLGKVSKDTKKYKSFGGGGGGGRKERN